MMSGRIALRTGVLLLILLALLLPALACAAQDAGEGGSKIVRVGYVNHAGYEEGGEGEYKTGYGYEYLQRISYQTGWRYEYVYGSFSELFEMLKRGEIDLMGDISYLDERVEFINYSAYPMSKEYYYLVCNSENTSLRPNDITALSGKKIGVTQNSFQATLLEGWLKNNRIDAQVVPYKGNREVLASLEDGMTDAAVITKTSNIQEHSTIANIGYSEVYFGLAKNREDLLREINGALYSIQSTDPLFNDKVTAKYASYQNADLVMSEEETAYLREHPVIRVGYLRDYLPLLRAQRRRAGGPHPLPLRPLLPNALAGAQRQPLLRAVRLRGGDDPGARARAGRHLFPLYERRVAHRAERFQRNI